LPTNTVFFVAGRAGDVELVENTPSNRNLFSGVVVSFLVVFVMADSWKSPGGGLRVHQGGCHDGMGREREWLQRTDGCFIHCIVKGVKVGWGEEAHTSTIVTGTVYSTDADLFSLAPWYIRFISVKVIPRREKQSQDTTDEVQMLLRS
jgi:hypothetical protein